MTTKYLQEGAVLKHTAGSDINSNEIVVIGDSVAVALVDIDSGETGSVQTEGVFDLPKVSGTSWSQGDKLDWDSSEGAFGKGITSEAGDVTGCAIAAADAESGDTTGEVKLTNPGTAQ